MKDAKIQAFVDEYVALCKKHNLLVSYDDGVPATEVSRPFEGSFDDIEDIDGWEFWEREASRLHRMEACE